jgi:hypothetical protein
MFRMANTLNLSLTDDLRIEADLETDRTVE